MLYNTIWQSGSHGNKLARDAAYDGDAEAAAGMHKPVFGKGGEPEVCHIGRQCSQGKSMAVVRWRAHSSHMDGSSGHTDPLRGPPPHTAHSLPCGSGPNTA